MINHIFKLHELQALISHKFKLHELQTQINNFCQEYIPLLPCCLSFINQSFIFSFLVRKRKLGRLKDTRILCARNQGDGMNSSQSIRMQAFGVGEWVLQIPGKEKASRFVCGSLRENHPADGAGVALLGNLQISPTHNTEMVCTGINRPTAGFVKTSEGNSSWVD